MPPAQSPALKALSKTAQSCIQQPSAWRPLPFLLPRAARHINTTSTLVENDAMPHDLLTTPPQQEISSSPTPNSRYPTSKSNPLHKTAYSPRYSPSRAPTAPTSSTTATSTSSIATAPASPTPLPQKPLFLSPSILQNLPHLAAQSPYYINIHIHGRPYLVTAGDTLRLPFLMHGVLPGDILRLDRASALGSRDWTLKAGLAPLDSNSADSLTLEPSTEEIQQELAPNPTVPSDRKPRFRAAYLDDRLFVCRAVVLGTESEPMRIKEKTKRRQRRVKKVKSKHRFTVLRIGEVSLGEVGGQMGGEVGIAA